jgi:hypothetical protein
LFGISERDSRGEKRQYIGYAKAARGQVRRGTLVPYLGTLKSGTQVAEAFGKDLFLRALGARTELYQLMLELCGMRMI